MTEQGEVAGCGPDPVAFSDTMMDVATRTQRIAARFVEDHAAGHIGGDWDPLGLVQTFVDAMSRMRIDPLAVASAQLRFWQDSVHLWQTTAANMLGFSHDAVIEPDHADRRFRDQDWRDSALFDFIKQSYLLASRYVLSTLDATDGLDDKTRQKVEFYTRQYVDAISPTNFAATNPVVMRATLATHGENLVSGLQNMLADLEHGNGRLQPRMTDTEAFALGENIAITPGKVVFQTDMMQLIQYQPSTAKVFRRPLLVIPPWINKYYILDLRPNNSLVKWLVDQGHTVFVMSWVNPDERHRDKSFDHYVQEGIVAALDAIEQASGEREVNVIGYCLGGTLLAMTLGYLAACRDSRVKRIKSATFFTTLIDFAEPGDLGVFIDDQQVSNLEKTMAEKGYLEGLSMANTFNMLRANDLIWSFVINNYLLGKDPMAFDLLYWNSDSTRMPARMHSEYLRQMYMNNQLREPGGIVVNGTPVDLGAVKTPSYFLSTCDDHIAPWKSTFAGARLFSGPVRFVLAGSGHIAGVVNPPVASKYAYWTCSRKPATVDDPDRWFEGADRHDGSWWTDWHDWAIRHAGALVSARKPGGGKLKVIEDAPGSYAKVRAVAG